MNTRDVVRLEKYVTKTPGEGECYRGTTDVISFCIRVQRHERRHKTRKNLGYFIKQIENSFRVSVL